MLASKIASLIAPFVQAGPGLGVIRSGEVLRDKVVGEGSSSGGPRHYRPKPFGESD